MSGQWLEAVSQVARLAGQSALGAFRARAGLVVETKGDGTPVTAADREAERVARAWVETHYPNDGIVGEEGDTVRPEAKRRWFIDPIDGTKAFIRGVPLWGTLVAVAEGDEVLAGAIYVPCLDELVAAERGQGCFFNGVRTHVSTVATLDRATVLTTDAGRNAKALRGLLEAAPVSRTWGDCYGYLLVATGRAEAMVDPILSDWDSAALQPIIEEAGGTFTSLGGERTAFGKSAVATNAALAKAVRSKLEEAPRAVQRPKLSLDAVDFSKGLVPIVTQDAISGAVLMLAYTDREALERTVATGLMHYRSRTRGLWKKGETSGNVQHVVSLSLDCDADTILARVTMSGPACHTGEATCFGVGQGDALSTLAATIAARATSPADGSYTSKLLGNRNLRLKKLGEEIAELLVCLADGERVQAAEEAADVIYHCLVALQAEQVTLAEVRQVLHQRAK